MAIENIAILSTLLMKFNYEYSVLLGTDKFPKALFMRRPNTFS